MPPSATRGFSLSRSKLAAESNARQVQNLKEGTRVHDDHCHARPPSSPCSTATPAPVRTGKDLTGQGRGAPRQPLWPLPFEQRWHRLRMVQKARLSGTRDKRWTEASGAVEGIPRADSRQVICFAARRRPWALKF